MRAFIALCSVALVAGCATGPKAPAEEHVVPLDATNIVPAQRAGYKIVNKDGQKLYCKRSLNTGSHLRYTTTCLTEKEWEELADDSKRSIQAMKRDLIPKQGT
jgi:hypothetical protein